MAVEMDGKAELDGLDFLGSWETNQTDFDNGAFNESHHLYGNDWTHTLVHPCNAYIYNMSSENQTDLFDEDVFLSLCLGDKRHPYKYLIPLTVVNCLMFVTGTIGNLLVCYVIMQSPGMRTSTNFFLFSLSMSDLTLLFVVMFITGVFGNLSVCCVILRIPGMRSATNYYLFSLAVADMLILLLGLPNDLHVYWQQYPWIFGEPLCKIRALVSEMTSYSSVLTIVAFSMERYLAICHPLYSYTMSGLQRASKIIGALWLFALASAIPYAIYTKVHYIDHPFTNQTIPESAFCTIQPTPTFLFEFSSFLFFIIPMTIMIFLYVRMGFRIRQTATFGKNTAVHGESRSVQSKKAILKMLAAVVFAFFICWAPFHAQRLLYVVFYEYKWKFVSEEVYQQINEKLFYVTGCFYYFSSTVNPILYNVMSVKYRNAFKETLCGRKSDGGNPLFTSYNPGPGGGGVVSYRRESNAYSTTLANSTRNGHLSYGKQMSCHHLSVYDPYGSRENDKTSNNRGQRPRRHSLITEGGPNSIRSAKRDTSDSRTPSGSSVFPPSPRNQSETSFVDKSRDGLKIVVERESFRN